MRNKDAFSEMGDMINKDMFKTTPENLPANDDELDLHMMIDYKDDIEIAEEKAITSIKKLNSYGKKRLIDQDQTVLESQQSNILLTAVKVSR